MKLLRRLSENGPGNRPNLSRLSGQPKLRATHLFLVLHNTFVAPAGVSLDDFEKKLRAFAERIVEGSVVYAELDRAAYPGLILPNCEQLAHLGEIVATTEFVVQWLERVGKDCKLFVLFDFKRDLVPTEKTQRCVNEWKALLQHVNYTDRPADLRTAKAESCDTSGAPMLKVYSSSHKDSPLYAALVCGSEYQAFDPVAKDAHSALLRATLCRRGEDRTLSFADTELLDYTRVKVTVKLRATQPLKIAYMEDSESEGGAPSRVLTKKRIPPLGSAEWAEVSWVTRRSFASFALKSRLAKRQWDAFVMGSDDFNVETSPPPEPFSDLLQGVTLQCVTAPREEAVERLP